MSIEENFSNKEKHQIFNQDVSQLKEYVYKLVEVKTVEDRAYIGWVYTVDPVSESFVLVTLDESYQPDSLHLILGHAVRNIKVLNDATPSLKQLLDRLFRNKPATEDVKNLEEKRQKLKAWLMQNRVPFAMTGESNNVFTIMDAVTIFPPYGAADCQSTNEIVLERIQMLIQAMPQQENNP